MAPMPAQTGTVGGLLVQDRELDQPDALRQLLSRWRDR
jgi:hypothetical protein